MYRFNNTDTSPASIPSKYQRVVIIRQEKKGFSSQAQRFPSQDCLSENPGPASYDCVSSAEVQSPSFSKKGTTGFVPSKAVRPSDNPHRSSPGPNAYNLQSSFVDKHKLGPSRVFRLPVAVQLGGPKHETPAPNQYDVSCDRTPKRFSSVVGTSAFLSKTKRFSFYPNDVPSPCHYEVRDNVNQRDTKAIVSPFKSKTQRIPPPVDHHVPGPAAYSPHQTPAPEKRTSLPFLQSTNFAEAVLRLQRLRRLDSCLKLSRKPALQIHKKFPPTQTDYLYRNASLRGAVCLSSSLNVNGFLYL